MTSRILEKNLKAYEVYIDYWDKEANDTFLLVGLRGWLRDHAVELNSLQKQRLYEIDHKVLQLAAQDYDVETEDVEDLRLIVCIINGQSEQKVA